MKKKGNLNADNPDRLNVIVSGSKVIGDMITESNLRIDGEIIGNISSSAKIVIGKTGIVNGNINCNDADIEGNVSGDLKIEALLTLRTSANIEGNISTVKLQMEEGAEFSGSCRMNNFTKGYTTEGTKATNAEPVK